MLARHVTWLKLLMCPLSHCFLCSSLGSFTWHSPRCVPAFIDPDLILLPPSSDTITLAPPILPHPPPLPLQVQEQAAHRPGGAWGLADSKRLWHELELRYRDMGVVEAGVRSREEERAGNKEATGGG